MGSLNAEPVIGSFPPDIERELLRSPDLLPRIAQALVDSQFPRTVAPDVLTAVGLDPDVVLNSPRPDGAKEPLRTRDVNWRRQVVTAWDRCCAFCGYDGTLNGAPVGIEAAHIRWFTFGGPDSLDNGLALCSLHHKLLDRGALGLRDPGTIFVSETFSATGEVGRAVYGLHGRELRPRPGTLLPAVEHIQWHRQEVFKGDPLAA